MSSSESGSDVSSSFSEGSDNERSTKRDLVIPSPVELNDSDDDGFSPSQHDKLAMKKQLARHDLVPNSTSGSDEEEEEVVEEEVEQFIDGQSGQVVQRAPGRRSMSV
jgi:hypothetical protein